MPVEITFRDFGLALVRQRLRELGELAITVGFQGPEGAQLYPTGVNVATVATFQEFGTRKIPQRAFLRSTFFERRDDVERIMAGAVESTITERTVPPVQALSDAGRAIVRLVERKINTSRGWAKPNRPATIAKKGFDYPLHDTDLMARSVTWAVRRGGSIVATGGSA
jgi:hypothetical protein